MPRTYRRRTGWVPQAERKLAVRADVPDAYDTDRLIDVFLLHVLGMGLESKLGPDKVMMLKRQLPPTRAAPLREAA